MKNYLLKELHDPASKSTGYQKIAMSIYLTLRGLGIALLRSKLWGNQTRPRLNN